MEEGRGEVGDGQGVQEREELQVGDDAEGRGSWLGELVCEGGDGTSRVGRGGEGDLHAELLEPVQVHTLDIATEEGFGGFFPH